METFPNSSATEGIPYTYLHEFNNVSTWWGASDDKRFGSEFSWAYLGGGWSPCPSAVSGWRADSPHCRRDVCKRFPVHEQIREVSQYLFVLPWGEGHEGVLIAWIVQQLWIFFNSFDGASVGHYLLSLSVIELVDWLDGALRATRGTVCRRQRTGGEEHHQHGEHSYGCRDHDVWLKFKKVGNHTVETSDLRLWPAMASG